MTDSGFEAFDRFVDQMGEHFAATDDGPERWRGALPIFRRLLTDRVFRAAALDWPSVDGALLLYEDPEHGYVVDATVKEPGAATPVHDHGDTCVIYGSLHGNEVVKRYEADGDALRETQSSEFFSSDIDLVLPGEIHAQHNRPAKTVSLVLRSGKPGTFAQSRYDDAGHAEAFHGPRMVPFDMRTGRVK